MMDMAMFSFMRSSMIRNAVKLGIADALRAGPLDATKLASAVGAAKVSFLERIMRLLIRMGMIKIQNRITSQCFVRGVSTTSRWAICSHSSISRIVYNSPRQCCSRNPLSRITPSGRMGRP